MFKIVDHEMFKVGELSTFNTDADCRRLEKEAVGFAYHLLWRDSASLEREVRRIRIVCAEWRTYLPGCKPRLSFRIK